MTATPEQTATPAGVAFTIVPRDEQVRADTISVLEDMLARAKAGEVFEVAVACTTSDRCSLTSFSYDTRPAILGAIAQMQHRILTGT